MKGDIKLLVGQEVGIWHIDDYKYVNKKPYLVCHCVNGHEKCFRKDRLYATSPCFPCNDLSPIGDMINGNKVLAYKRTDKYHNKYYLWECSCGKEFVCTYGSIKSGHTRTCGHLWNKYGELSKDPRYSNWSAMIQRTTNPNHQSFEHYDKLIQGTKIEPAWIESPRGFFHEIGPKPTGDYSVDRIDNSKGYVRGNVKWSTRQEQQLNRFVTPGVTGEKFIYLDKRRGTYSVSRYEEGERVIYGYCKTLEEAISIRDRNNLLR